MGNLLKVIVWFGLGFGVTEFVADMLAVSGKTMRSPVTAKGLDIRQAPQSVSMASRSHGHADSE